MHKPGDVEILLHKPFSPGLTSFNLGHEVECKGLAK